MFYFLFDIELMKNNIRCSSRPIQKLWARSDLYAFMPIPLFIAGTWFLSQSVTKSFAFFTLTFITMLLLHFAQVLLRFSITHTHTHTHSFCLRRRSLALLSASWSARLWGGSSPWLPRSAVVESAWPSRSRHSSAIFWEIHRQRDRAGGQRKRVGEKECRRS